MRRVRGRASNQPRNHSDEFPPRRASRNTCRSILAGRSYKFDVPSRAAGNQAYVPELDRIVLKQNTSERSFANVGQVRKTAIMTRVLSLVHEVCSKDIHVTKRDLFCAVSD